MEARAEGASEGQLALSLLQETYLVRLRRLEKIRLMHGGIPNADDFMVRLVKRGLFATYRDCVDEGVGPQAREILGM